MFMPSFLLFVFIFELFVCFHFVRTKQKKKTTTIQQGSEKLQGHQSAYKNSRTRVWISPQVAGLVAMEWS